MSNALLLATEHRLPSLVQTIGLFTGQHNHANLRLYRRHGYRQTHTIQAGAYHLVHLAKDRPGWPGRRGTDRPGKGDARQ